MQCMKFLLERIIQFPHCLDSLFLRAFLGEQTLPYYAIVGQITRATLAHRSLCLFVFSA